jgi:hypothetical protein
MAQAEAMANQAVFQLQFNTRDAVGYVVRNANVDVTAAQRAVKTALTFGAMASREVVRAARVSKVSR